MQIVIWKIFKWKKKEYFIVVFNTVGTLTVRVFVESYPNRGYEITKQQQSDLKSQNGKDLLKEIIAQAVFDIKNGLTGTEKKN